MELVITELQRQMPCSLITNSTISQLHEGAGLPERNSVHSTHRWCSPWWRHLAA